MTSTDRSLDASIAVVSLSLLLNEIHRRSLVDRGLVLAVVEMRSCETMWALVAALRGVGEGRRAMGLLRQVQEIGAVGTWEEALQLAAPYAREAWESFVEIVQS